jgi:TRAP-type C4-dicarboxylate transport system substrate-binding protein
MARRLDLRLISRSFAALCLAPLLSCAPGRAPATERPRLFLRLAEERAGEHPSLAAEAEFVAACERGAAGAVRVRVFPGGELGDEASVVEQLRFGGIDLARVQVRALEALAPTAGGLAAPGRFPSAESLRQALAGPEGEALASELLAAKLVLLAWYDGGPESFLLPPGAAAAGPAGLRVGVEPSRSAMDLVAARGGTPVPLALREFRRAFDAGLVDAFFLPRLAAESERLSDRLAPLELADSRSVELLVASRSIYQKMLPVDRGLVLKAARESQLKQAVFCAEAERRRAGGGEIKP